MNNNKKNKLAYLCLRNDLFIYKKTFYVFTLYYIMELYDFRSSVWLSVEDDKQHNITNLYFKYMNSFNYMGLYKIVGNTLV